MIVLGLGSSDRAALDWLRRAVAALKARPELRLLRSSPIYASDALLPEGAPESWNVPYLNLAIAAVAADGLLTPARLLHALKDLERELGRRERPRWAPREIDIDLLAWDGVHLDTPTLRLPHPGLLERPFALLPLADVAPELLAPGRLAAGTRALEQARLWSAPGASVPFRTRRTLDRLTELVAILNLTPDSFSDGGRLATGQAILEAAHAAIDSGARVLDLGAESTRPGAKPITEDEEWRRLEPALKLLAPLRASVPGLKLSLDTRHAGTAERALETGALDWLNDVSGLVSDRMVALARAGTVDVVVMHSLSVPARRDQVLPRDADAPSEVVAWGQKRLASLVRQGIAPGRVILDPGVGFGKTAEQSLELLRQAWRLHEWGARVLIGHSRKSFLAGLESDPAGRDLETALISARLADQGIEYLRVHDCGSQARALRLSAAWDGRAELRGARPC